ncbi:hypothetical protein N781_15185 [Pontibacillus halophilus JSM 076056 = DSM 19796]|uniref:Formyl transferase N-terminal domain-containing protein n=1 Tax=Pontibacillus halophilus JSM 076056 = DSM 19796 TaxID=1385510 RepID=A0A0A5GHB8_9BACI|nr:formyltetrahydrofolate deformylase [Pontibacillus halophilus]KGX92661.1 hypothetical protein N781_15185 [Pontibacillus halophilus JSM 076056 = DSM 19796]
MLVWRGMTPIRTDIQASLQTYLETHDLHAFREIEYKGVIFFRGEFHESDSCVPESYLQAQLGSWSNLTIPKRIALFVSTLSHCAIAILEEWRMRRLGGEVVCVISNHEDLRPLVEGYGVPFYYIPTANVAQSEKRQLQVLRELHVEVIVLARYMQMLSEEFVGRYTQQIINIHHSLLPAFVGAAPYEKAYERGVKLVGATAHYVTEGMDEGEIIEQQAGVVEDGGTAEHYKVLNHPIEAKVLLAALHQHLQERIFIYDGRTIRL